MSNSRPRVQIKSTTGMPRDTDVSLDNGQRLYPKAVFINMDAQSMGEAVLEFSLPTLDLTVDLERVEFLCPCCSETIKHECEGLSTISDEE